MKLHLMQRPLPVALIAALFLLSCGGGESEQKKEGSGSERTVKQDTTSSAKKNDPEITAAKFANAVRKRIVDRAKKNDGILHLPDPRKDGDTLRVELKNVVEASVGKSAADVRYVCAKFKGVEDGMDYDIDFFLKGNEPSKLEPTREPLIHKVDGEARYEYVKKDGVKKPKRIQADDEKDKEVKMKGKGKDASG